MSVVPDGEATSPQVLEAQWLEDTITPLDDNDNVSSGRTVTDETSTSPERDEETPESTKRVVRYEVHMPLVGRQIVIPQALLKGGTSGGDGIFGRIPFRHSRKVVGKQGVLMSLLLGYKERKRGPAPPIKDPHDEVFADLLKMGMNTIRLVITWPAYPSMKFDRHIQVVNPRTGKSITRITIARAIADAFEDFVDLAQGQELSQDKWEASFQFARGFLDFGQLWLISLWHLKANVFEAEVRHSMTRVHCGHVWEAKDSM